MLNLKVINLFGAPGVGKSTVASGLFNLMKAHGEHVELVTEYAKELTYSEHYADLSNQLSILAHQDARLRRLEGKVEWVITDSPLPTGLAFINEEYKEWLTDAIWGAYDRYHNYDILLHRNPSYPFQTFGRNESLEQALCLDEVLASIFNEAVNGDDDFAFQLEVDHMSPYNIYRWLKE